MVDARKMDAGCITNSGSGKGRSPLRKVPTPAEEAVTSRLLRAHGPKAYATPWLPQLRRHGLQPVDHYACCALRIDRRLGTLRPITEDRPASGICA